MGEREGQKIDWKVEKIAKSKVEEGGREDVGNGHFEGIAKCEVGKTW